MAGTQHNVITKEFKDSTRKRIRELSRESSDEVRILMNADDFTISRVPPRFARSKERSYEPSVVAIGPYHHGKKVLQAMEEHKWWHLHSFLQRKCHPFKAEEIYGKEIQAFSLDDYIKMLLKNAARARMYYFEHMDMADEKLVEMLLLDGCFVVETILRWQEGKHIISYSSWFSRQIWEDLLLFENQIPFFILDNLYRAVTTCENESFVDIVRAYICNRLLPMEVQKEKMKNMVLDGDNVSHLLQLFYNCTISKPQGGGVSTKISLIEEIASLRWLNPLRLISKFFALRRPPTIHGAPKIPTATKLKDAGVTFRAKASENFIDITFNRGVLEIPPFVLDYQRKCRMMNLIAFEQSNNGLETLTCYADFMDSIIDTESDVEILQEAGIIISYLRNNEETALFFNQLNEQTTLSFEHVLTSLMGQINEYVEVDWHKWRARLRGQYFSNPWAIISLVAAGILLILTIVQTFYTIYPYYHPRSS